jgi:hypothetical protein
MTTENRGVMSRWMRESMTALEQLRRERDHHEHALEAAMEAIRVHTQAIDALERDIGVIEKAMAGTESRVEAEPAEVEAAAAAEEFEVSLPTMVHVSAMVPPRPPPLRPVPRAVGQR